MPDAPAHDHHLPFRLADLERHALADRPDAEAEGRVLRLTRLVLGEESRLRVERLKAAFRGLDPRDGERDLPGSPAPDPAAFSRELAGLLERANYRRISEQELHRAFSTESLFRVRLHTDLGDFAELSLWSRGRHHRVETIRSWFGLRRRALDVESCDRVVLLARFREAGHFAGRKRRRALPVQPGATVLKLFADVPIADLEMLFPNSEVRMKPVDQALIGVPALLGLLGLASKIAVLAIPFIYLASHVGLAEQPAKPPWGELLAIGGAAFAVYVFINRQFMRYRFRKMQFLQTLSDSLYVRNLDNGAGAFHRVADEALEEECKEAALAWRFLLDGPATAPELDARIERWFSERLGATVDFEVDDALAKLARLGLAREEAGSWRAAPAAEALDALRRRWNAGADP